MHFFDEGKESTMTVTIAEEKAEKIFCAMGTLMSFTVYGAYAQEALKAAEAITVKLDNLLARTKPDGEITRLNHSGGKDWTKVQEDTDSVLREALRYAEKTQGVYDPSIGALVDLWNVKARREKNLPDLKEIRCALASCDYRNIETNHAGGYRIQHGASIDLGGIGKGYAADRICALCRERDALSALFSLGTSSIAALGSKPDGSAWKIGLRAVGTDKIECFGVVHLKDQFLSTSGDYEQGFVKNGHRYHHILDKRSGYPAESGLRSVTVIANSGAMSEAYSTALFVMGLDKALDFHQREGEFEMIVVTSDSHVICTPKLQEMFEFTGETLGYEYPQYELFRR